MFEKGGGKVGKENVGGKFVWGPPKIISLKSEGKMRSKEEIFIEIAKMSLLK